MSIGQTKNVVLEHPNFSVVLPEVFPYSPPRVTTGLIRPRSWHQEGDGGLCLYPSRDRERLPWLDPDEFLGRVEQWFEKSRQGWPDDPPALDLEAYLELPADPRLVVHDDLAPLVGGYVTFRRDGDKLLHLLRSGKAAKKRDRELTGFVGSVGELAAPPQDWEDLFNRLDQEAVLRQEIARGRLEVLLIRYQRSDQTGVVAITFPTSNRDPWLAPSAGLDRSTMSHRSGPASSELDSKHVYIVGSGALGSHICDGLSRAGIGHLTIRDPDHMTPGNMTRHFVTDLTLCGVNKASAVKTVLTDRPYNRSRIVDVQNGVMTPGEALELLAGNHLVVDATADGAATAMLEEAAKFTGIRFFTACLQNDGRTQRIDLVPPLDGAQPLAATKMLPTQGREIFEAGCGDPVSPTPPYAVAEAAGMAVRHIIGYLIGEPVSAAGEVREV